MGLYFSYAGIHTIRQFYLKLQNAFPLDTQIPNKNTQDRHLSSTNLALISMASTPADTLAKTSNPPNAHLSTIFHANLPGNLLPN